MKNCKDIENNLSLYLDNLLSAADKCIIEEHLKSCPKCAEAIAGLRKVNTAARELSEVEPPPWFKQKIMARVREEANKKSFAEKWFYPLRIKIPIQVFATIFIVVIAVYIYRADDEQMKAVMPPEAPTPVMETKKDQLSGQATKLPDADKTTVKKKVAARKDARDEKMVIYDVSPGAAAPKTQALKKTIPQENMRAGAADMAKAMKQDAAVDKRAETYAAMPAKSMPPSNVEMERKKEGSVLGASIKQTRTPEAQSIMPKATVSVRVENINTAVGEVEKILNKYEAKKMVRQMLEGKVIFTAELKDRNIKDFIEQLKTIGRVEEGITPVDNFEQYIVVVIEIKNQ